MDYLVEEIAQAAGISVDTVRFYQSRGLLPAPERRGRRAVYSESHLERLHRIRALNREGLTLQAVRRVLEQSASENVRQSLLDALSESEGDRKYSRSELAATAGVPELLIEAVEQAQLFEPIQVDGEPRYTDADLRAAQAALRLLQAGLPVHELLPLAERHASHVAEIADVAVELFDRYVREAGDGGGPAQLEDVTEAFRELLPAVTTLVALHFQRTLIQRARARLERTGDDDALRAALEATESSRLRVSWS